MNRSRIAKHSQRFVFLSMGLGLLTLYCGSDGDSGGDDRTGGSIGNLLNGQREQRAEYQEHPRRRGDAALRKEPRDGHAGRRRGQKRRGHERR